MTTASLEYVSIAMGAKFLHNYTKIIFLNDQQTKN